MKQLDTLTEAVNAVINRRRESEQLLQDFEIISLVLARVVYNLRPTEGKTFRSAFEVAKAKDILLSLTLDYAVQVLGEYENRSKDNGPVDQLVLGLLKSTLNKVQTSFVSGD